MKAEYISIGIVTIMTMVCMYGLITHTVTMLLPMGLVSIFGLSYLCFIDLVLKKF